MLKQLLMKSTLKYLNLLISQSALTIVYLTTLQKE